MTSYAYDSSGDVAQVTDPLGLVTKYTYDNLGRELTETQVSDSYPAGLTTSYTYDGLDRVLTETDPPVTDRVTGAVHTKVTSYTYDAGLGRAHHHDQRRDRRGSVPDHHQHLQRPRPARHRPPIRLGNTTSYTYDPFGDLATETNPAGLTTAYAYDAAGNLLTTTLEGYTGNPSNPIAPENLVEESRAYDPAGRLASVTNVVGTTTDYTYYDNNQLASSYVADPAAHRDAERHHLRLRRGRQPDSPRPPRAAWSPTSPTTPTTSRSRRRWTRPAWTASPPPPTTPTGTSSPSR